MTKVISRMVCDFRALQKLFPEWFGVSALAESHFSNSLKLSPYAETFVRSWAVCCSLSLISYNISCFIMASFIWWKSFYGRDSTKQWTMRRWKGWGERAWDNYWVFHCCVWKDWKCHVGRHIRWARVCRVPLGLSPMMPIKEWQRRWVHAHLMGNWYAK